MNNKDLTALLDSMKETGVYVIEDKSHKILYFNERAKQIAPQIELGMVCNEVWGGECENCPLLTSGDEEPNYIIHNNGSLGEEVELTANRLTWDGKDAFSVIVTPHRPGYDEQQNWLMQIKEIYAQSLVTVFRECLIINLTDDYFVTCQIGGMGLELSERLPFEEVSRDYFEQIIHPDELEQFLQCFSGSALNRAFKKNKSQIIKRFLRESEDGTYHMAEFTATRAEQFDAMDEWCVLVSRDVHEEYVQEQLKNMEMSQMAAALKGAYQRLITINLTQKTYHILEQGGDSYKKVPENGTIDSVIEGNAFFVEPIYQEEYRNLFSAQALLDAFEKGDQKVSMELRQLNKEGQYYWCSVQVVRVHSSYSGDILAIAMCKSIEKQRRQQEENLEKERATKLLLEEALKEANDANRAKSEFLSKVSHDIRTPLNAIIGMTALAQAFPKDEKRLGGYLNSIKMSGDHLLGLVNDVLDMSKIENGEISLSEETVDIKKLARDTISLVRPKADEKNQILETEIASGMHTLVSGDEQRLRQILINILENASKYTPQGGHIKLRIEEQTDTVTRVSYYLFIVEDNGIGMEKEFLEHIYEPFTRARDTRINKIAGFGLGMTIVRNFVSMMGGDIKVESKIGKGTRFTIRLYLEHRSLDGNPAKDIQAVSDGNFSNMRVLVAEDNAMNQEIITEMLNLIGAKVEIAHNGKEAAEAVLSNPAFYYDLVFMDIRMPEMDGYEAARQIREQGKETAKNLPIIALTADAFTNDAKKAKQAGMDGHLSKPITMDKLKQALEYCRKWGIEKLTLPFYGDMGE